MKKTCPIKTWLIMIVFAGLFLPSCVKDKCTRTYRIYTPVYKTKAQVRAAIKTNAPRIIVDPGKLFIRGPYIFLNDVNRGIHLIDNTNPSSPQNIGFIDIPGNVDMAVKGNTLYADLYSDLVTLDISNPLQVVTKKIAENTFPYRRYANGFVADTNQIIIEWINKDTTVAVDCNGGTSWRGCSTCGGVALDLSSATLGSSGSSPFGIGGSMARFTIVSSTLYTVSNTELSAFSISAPENPVFTNKVSLGWGIETIYPFKDKLFIGSNNGMFIYDIGNPDKPSRVGQFMHARACDPVIADENYAFVTLRNGPNCPRGSNQMDIINISNLTSPSLVKTYPMTNPHGLSKDGNILFVCEGKDGLKVYDASQVNDLKLLDHIKGFESYDVIAFKNLALVVTKDGLRQYDYSSLTDIRLLSRIEWE